MLEVKSFLQVRSGKLFPPAERFQGKSFIQYFGFLNYKMKDIVLTLLTSQSAGND